MLLEVGAEAGHAEGPAAGGMQKRIGLVSLVIEGQQTWQTSLQPPRDAPNEHLAVRAGGPQREGPNRLLIVAVAVLVVALCRHKEAVRSQVIGPRTQARVLGRVRHVGIVLPVSGVVVAPSAGRSQSVLGAADTIWSVTERCELHVTSHQQNA